MAGLGFNIAGAVWDSRNVIGSIYPLPSIATITLYGSGGPTPVLGSTPSVINTPIINANSFIGNSMGGGYDTGVSDSVTKTLMLLCKPSKAGTGKSKGIGTYTGSGSSIGDTLIFDSTTNRISSIAGASSGFVQDLVNAEIYDGKFYVVFADFALYKTQIFACKEGGLIAGPGVGLTTRAVPDKTIRIARTYESADTSGNADIEIAASGIWSGALLTSEQKLQMRNALVSRLGGIIAIG